MEQGTERRVQQGATQYRRVQQSGAGYSMQSAGGWSRVEQGTGGCRWIHQDTVGYWAAKLSTKGRQQPLCGFETQRYGWVRTRG